MLVRSATTGRESYIPVNYTARVTHRWATWWRWRRWGFPGRWEDIQMFGTRLELSLVTRAASASSSFTPPPLADVVPVDFPNMKSNVWTLVLNGAYHYSHANLILFLFFLFRWLFTGISRYKAEELLKHSNNQSGAFLIRESETHRGGSPFLKHRRWQSGD